MILKTTYTHKGWFFLCPVYMDAEQGDGMSVAVRRPWLGWWFDVNAAAFALVASFSNNEEPFPFRVTGKLENPVVIECEVD